jgi:hypothetical protein
MKLLLVLLFLIFNGASQTYAQPGENSGRFWEVQSIDTMKYSRDRSREFLANIPGAKEKVVGQISVIADAGATHVAIGTPYDSEFLPILQLWVQTARDHNLKVWFRGNWSGWEGWFDYPAITRQEHLVKTQVFIQENEDLFQDGDIFTACPECENGGAGDPRSETDLLGFRNFLIMEQTMLEDEFKKQGKKITVNFNSMNKDVAQLVMDEETTKKLGNIVAIDHYVSSAAQVAFDSSQLAQISGGKIVLSEFGSPIPDLHGNQTEVEQAQWLDDALLSFVATPEIVALNYWTSFDGSTALWKNNGSEKLAAGILKKYYQPQTVSGYILDEKQNPLQSAEIVSQYRRVFTDQSGFFVLPYLFEDESIVVRKRDYQEVGFLISNVGGKTFTLSLVPENQSLFSQIFHWLVDAVKFW